MDGFVSEPITLLLEPIEEPKASAAPAIDSRALAPAPTTKPVAPVVPPAGESAAITPSARVDWPIEAKKSCRSRAGGGGRSRAHRENVCRARRHVGVAHQTAALQDQQIPFQARRRGLEKDSDGNIIYHLSEGCVVVNSSFIGCAIGKAKIHDDMFGDMRLYFDEQRLPRTDEGNGTEPESLAQPF